MESIQGEAETRTTKTVIVRCMLELVTAFLFLGVFLMGLSLVTAGMFKEQVNVEARSTIYFGFKLALPVGILMIAYSCIGISRECRNMLEGKVSFQDKSTRASRT